MPAKKYDGLIFDLDGTLWDASGTCTKAWNATLKQSGIEGHLVDEAAIRSFSGMQIEKVFQQQFDFIPLGLHKDLLAAYKVNETLFMKEFGGELFPVVRDELLNLKEVYPLFIVSNCLAGYIENFISFTSLQEIFEDFESAGNTGLSKAENIRLIIARNKLENSVYLGDTKWDAEAAEKANVPFIHAAYGFGKVDYSDWRIDRFADLQELLSRMSFQI